MFGRFGGFQILFSANKSIQRYIWKKVILLIMLSYQISMETIFPGYLGYKLKNIPKTFHLELFPYQRYIQNSNFIILSRKNCEGIILSIF